VVISIIPQLVSYVDGELNMKYFFLLLYRANNILFQQKGSTISFNPLEPEAKIG